VVDLGPIPAGGLGSYAFRMHVTAISTPRQPQWRWRISEDTGELVEESRDGFATLAAAMAEGTKRMASITASARFATRS
jgi:hypothetical protein